MSPEAASGDITRIGPRSDVYSLGATLYHLLTGKAPFTRSVMASEPILARVITGKFPGLREVWSEVPPALEAICKKAMALAPDDRYKSPRKLAEHVRLWQEGEPIPGVHEPLSNRIARRVRKHPVLTVAAIALVLGAAMAFGLHWADPLRGSGAGLEEANAKLQEVRTELDENKRLRAALSDKLDASTAAAKTAESERDKATRDAMEARKTTKDAQGEAAKWKELHETAEDKLAKLEKERKEYLKKFDLDKNGATRELLAAKRQLKAMNRHKDDVNAWFEKSHAATVDVLEAFLKRLGDPKNKEHVAASNVASGVLQMKLGTVHAILGNHDDADHAYEDAMEILECCEATKEVTRYLAYVYHNRAWLFATRPAKREPREAVRFARLALETSIGLRDGKAPAQLKQLSPTDLAELAAAKPPECGSFVLTYGIALYRDENYPEARKVLKVAEDVLSKTALDKKSDHDARRILDDVDTSRIFLAMTAFNEKKRQDAETELARAQASIDGRVASLDVERFLTEAKALIERK
jgi:hypothetical protein